MLFQMDPWPNLRAKANRVPMLLFVIIPRKRVQIFGYSSALVINKKSE